MSLSAFLLALFISLPFTLMCSGLRVLHAASAVSGIYVVLKALGKLIPTLTNVLWVGLLFYYIFAVRHVCVCVCVCACVCVCVCLCVCE